MKKNIPDYTLNNGIKIPVVGFGTWQTPNDQTGVNAVKFALESGYRHIDTAVGYGNEASVGKAVKESGIARSEIFITSKLNNANHGYDLTVKTIESSLEELDTDYIDLYLIHWPNPKKFRDRWKEKNAQTWKAFEEYYKAGKIKALGVSNFMPHHLDALLETAKVIPAVNQIRLCPGDVNKELVDVCTKKGILLEAYSPLGTGQIFDVPQMKELSAKYGKSIAQISLRWSLQMGFLPLPKSVTPSRIEENIQIFDFELESKDVDLITGLTGCCGESKDPDKTEF
jgi:diketogulonate reductase-like aldo/keto reductase